MLFLKKNMRMVIEVVMKGGWKTNIWWIVLELNLKVVIIIRGETKWSGLVMLIGVEDRKK